MALSAAQIKKQLANATHLIEERGLRMTSLRQQVLALVLASSRPIGAYELLDQLKEEGHKGAAPPTVYRALEFLLEQGLVHKIEKLSAFIGCINDTIHGHTHAPHSHATQFLLCRECGSAIELNSPKIDDILKQLAQEHLYDYLGATVEIEGLCPTCKAKFS